jgi:uncharacterized protein involved in tellurium resistance
MELKKKGETAALGAFSQLKVSLIWSSAVDLDLMAFYKKKDASVGGVYSENYSGGSLGNLNKFPFIQLSGDAGVGAIGGDNREEMRITKLEDMEELFVVAVNFTDAVDGENKPFSNYDARVEVQTDTGETHVIRLDSSGPGSVAVLCKFTANFMGAQLANDSLVMDFDKFKSAVPGASGIKLNSKVTLKAKGDAHTFTIKQKDSIDEIMINLNWKTNADLDLGCFYELHPASSNGGGFFSKLMSSDNEANFSVIDGVQFSQGRGGGRNQQTSQGCYTKRPWIWHMGDDRTGAQSAEGETILVNPQGYSEFKRIHIYAFIFEGVSRWNQTDAVVTLKVPGNPDIVVEMGNQNNQEGMCLIATLDFIGGDQIRVQKQVSFHHGHSAADKAYGWGLKWQAGGK